MESQNDVSQQLHNALSRIIEAGYQIDAETLKAMRELSLQGILDETIENALYKATKQDQRPLFLSRGLLEASKPSPEILTENRMEGTSNRSEPYAKQTESQLEILKDPGNETGVAKDTDALKQYFRDRFSRISSILRKRSDARTAVSIEEALKAPPRIRNKIFCMITEKRERPRSLSLTVEDADSQVTVIISTSSDRSILDKARSLFLDQIVCIEVSRTQGEFLLAHDFFNPEIPDIPQIGSEEEIYAAFLSDLHVGSQKFLSTSFNQFLKWINGNSEDPALRRIAGRVKYLVIAGDLVDGIGVYPGQEQELAIKDIHQQYAEAAKLLAEIPSYVEIILIPGNHDATLQALPQPSILRNYAEQILTQDNVTSLGDPAIVRLHGVEVIIYHGQSLNDVIGTVPGVTYQNLNENITTAMRSLMKIRHLAPTYGGRTPIIPQIHDHLVIENPPSILHCGHLHVAGYEMYRGTLLLNSGTWQTQTEYQERMGVVPTPGIAPIVNLKTFAVLPLKY
ncbi:DNA-directed DNA polymerase II small subunit [Candidatus Bathyarchaeota archaeon]|nr:DNA-directed DNA polymerase II small subunit [Candidatus Bathyarchaeota archaeon]